MPNLDDLCYVILLDESPIAAFDSEYKEPALGYFNMIAHKIGDTLDEGQEISLELRFYHSSDGHDAYEIIKCELISVQTISSGMTGSA